MLEERARKASGPVVLMLICVLASAAPVHAQSGTAATRRQTIVSPESDTYNEMWRWAEFTDDSGLPSNRILDVVETDDGTVWASTQRGVARFDEFLWHPMGPSAGIPAEPPRAIVPYGSGDLLVVIGTHLYRGNRDHFYEVPIEVDGAPQRAVTLISGAPDTAVVLAAKDANAEVIPYIYRDNRFERMEPTAALVWEHDKVEGWGNGAGAIWLNTLDGLARWDGDEWTLRVPALAVSSLEVSRLVESPRGEGGLAAITHPFEMSGLWEWNAGGEPRLNRSEPGDLFEAMDISPRGDAVVVYRSDDVRIRRDGVWTALQPVPMQMANVTVVKFRPNGDLWVGSGRGLFLFRCSLDRWVHLELESPSSKNVINDLLRSQDGSVWLATGRGLVIHRPDGSVETIERILGEELLGTTGLAEDEEGGIWVSSGAAFEGAYRWDGTRWRHFGVADGLEALRVHKIRKDRRGRLWFLGMSPMTGFDPGEDQPGAFVYDGGTFTPWGPDQGLLHGRVYDFAEAADGTLWFATLRGLSRWRDGDWTHWTMADGLRKGRIVTIALDRDDQLWFGDQVSGLGYIRDERPHYLTSTDGLINDEVQEIRLGSMGELWISTKGGLARLHNGDWLQFDTRAGLSDPHLWPIVPTENAVYIGTSGSGIDILNLTEAANPHPIVRFLDAPRVEENSVLLRWETFAHLGQIAPGAIETRYRLVGDDWSGWSTGREVELTGLPTGEHTFEVQAKGLFGGFESAGKPTTFPIQPPLHLRPGFFAPVGTLGFLVVALLGTIVVRRRRHTTALREREDGYRRQLEQRVEARTLALRESEERLRLLLETTQVIPWEADARTWEFTYVGPQAVSILGYPVERWYAPDFWTAHIHPDDVEHAVAVCARNSALNQEYEFEYRMIAADGNVVWLHDIVSVISESGVPVTLRGFMIDITERKRAELERREAESETLEHRERLAHLSRVNMLGEMATGIAHEVNQPLAAVSTYTQACRRMIEAGTMDEDQLLDVLSRISDEAVRAGDMIHGLKALVRKRPSVLARCDVNDLIRDVVRLAEVEAREHNVEIDLDLREAVSPIVVDSVQIQQVVLNLVRNAIEAAEAGHGRVRIRTFRNGDENVEVEVIDNGAGIVEGSRERLFQPFFSTKGSGMGMGLSISRNIVEAHGGEIGYRDGRSGGSTFFFTLPTERDASVAGSH